MLIDGPKHGSRGSSLKRNGGEYKWQNQIDKKASDDEIINPEDRTKEGTQ